MPIVRRTAVCAPFALDVRVRGTKPFIPGSIDKEKLIGYGVFVRWNARSAAGAYRREIRSRINALPELSAEEEEPAVVEEIPAGSSRER